MNWSTVKFQLLENNTRNQRLLGSQESDHAVGVSVIQIIIFIIPKLFEWDLSTIYEYAVILKNGLNSELNAEIVLGTINSVRMLIVLMILEGYDAIKIALLMALEQNSPYQQKTQFGCIQIMSDILQVGSYKLFYGIFAELSLLYKQFIERIQVAIEIQSSEQVRKFLG